MTSTNEEHRKKQIRDSHGLGVATKGFLQQSREHRVAIRHVLLAFGERRDDVAERGERLVDRLGFLEPKKRMQTWKLERSYSPQVSSVLKTKRARAWHSLVLICCCGRVRFAFEEHQQGTLKRRERLGWITCASLSLRNECKCEISSPHAPHGYLLLRERGEIFVRSHQEASFPW